MDTEKRLGIKKPKAIMLFVQMILIVFLLIISVYLLAFVIANKLGGWMVTSYIFIIISVLAFIYYSVRGFRKGETAYKLSIAPFLAAVFVNILLPGRETFQVALLVLLFALVGGFLLRQNNKRFTQIVSIAMIVVSLTFSIYSSIKADTQFLGDISENLMTYIAMHSSIFIPTVMSVTIALTYDVRTERELLLKQENNDEI